MRKNLGVSILAVCLLTACAPGSDFRSAQWESGIASLDEEPENEDLSPIEDGQPPIDEAPDATPVEPTAYFAINRSPVKLAHDNAYTWLGCDKSALVAGGYNSNTTCGRAYFQPSYEKQINKHFFLCAERAAEKADLAQPVKLFINHMGSYNDRNARGSSRLSMHAYARALDIANFNLVDTVGKTTRVSTHVRNYTGATKKFYDEFRQCWKEQMPASCTTNQSEYKGSIGIPTSPLGGNSLHNDHIHLSYALCAGK